MAANLCKKLCKRILAVTLLGFFSQASVFAAESSRFIDPAAKKAGGLQNMCLKDQSLKIDEDVVAVVNKASGKVMVDKGKGFVTAEAGTVLKEGNRVVVLEESGAEIVFSDCCAMPLKANNLVTVNATPGCRAAVVDAAPAAPAVAGVHPASWIPPAGGVFIGIMAISHH
jgi:hypothetical protein